MSGTEVRPLPERDWDAMSSEKPWEVIVDSLLYQYRGAEMPEALRDGAMQSGMLVISMGLIQAEGYTLDDLDVLWARDWTFEFVFEPSDESLTAVARFDDGQEPSRVSVKGTGLRGRLVRFMADHGVFIESVDLASNGSPQGGSDAD